GRLSFSSALRLTGRRRSRAESSSWQSPRTRSMEIEKRSGVLGKRGFLKRRVRNASARTSSPGLRASHEGVLAALVTLEIMIFSDLGTNFLSKENAFQVARLSVEVGLLALAMTPVIVAGGIDLSAGSLLGLSAVLFGKMWRDGGLPIAAAALCTLGIGVAS